jgi:hypothetical protein
VFEAEGLNDSKYDIGETVYVLIPEGDYNSTNKVIIGNKPTDTSEEEKAVYLHSLDNVVISKAFTLLQNDECMRISANQYANDGVRVVSALATHENP